MLKLITHERFVYIFVRLDSGGGLVVSVIALYSDNPSSNPAEIYVFFAKCLKTTKIKKKYVGLAHSKFLDLELWNGFILPSFYRHMWPNCTIILL